MRNSSTQAWMRKIGLALFVILLAGCYDDQLGNLTLTDLDAKGEQTKFGEVVTLEYQFDSRGFTDQTTDIQFVLANVDDLHVDPDVEQELSEYHVVGIETVPLTNSITTHSVTFSIPETVKGGTYQVVAHIDPDNLIEEENEEDNSPTINDTDGTHHHALLQIQGPPEHDFHLENISLGIEQLILDTPETEALGEINRADIVGYVDLRYHGLHTDKAALTAAAEIDGVWVPLKFWHADSNSYTDDIIVDLSLDDQSNHIQFDLDLNANHLNALHASYDASGDNQLKIRLTATEGETTGQFEHSDDNNHLDITLSYYFFSGEQARQTTARSGVGTINYEKDFAATYGNTSKFAVAIDIAGKMSLVPLVDPGAAISGSGDVSAYFFNAHNTLFGVSFEGSAYASGNNSGYATEMVIFNATVLDEEFYNNAFSKTWEYTWEEERVLAQARFSIGPVPMSVEAGVSGNLGLELTVGYNAELTGGGDLFHVDFGAFGRGGINLLVASGGVQAIFTLIDNTFSMDSSAGFELANNGQNEPNIYYSIGLEDSIDAISGKFGLYAELQGIKWCKKWIIFYPCGTKTTHYDLWLYQTPSLLNKTWTLLSKEGQQPL
ncbi:CARDB domain-containing protein [Motilimonas eburnea]|uniref:CARDB domain-containing protein n=1 Tax=Motilimonas eburnea TaxID=1737488 RepID=UPI001E45C4E0|nr:CARDB domain-containing protein [Motilimonas eburnea]MCE2572202.1 hypothetical protein [Motilimonas eburnea]